MKLILIYAEGQVAQQGSNLLRNTHLLLTYLDVCVCVFQCDFYGVFLVFCFFLPIGIV